MVTRAPGDVAHAIFRTCKTFPVNLGVHRSNLREGAVFPATPGANARGDRWRPPAKPCGKIVPSRQTPAAASADSAGSLPDRRPGREAGRFGMGPAVVLGQDLAEIPGLHATGEQ